MIIKKLLVASTSDPGKIYTITIERNPDRVSCDCLGCVTHGYCKHMKIYYRVIQRLLHEKPGLLT